MNKWDERFLKLAEEVSTWSKDPSTQVGAVVAIENRVIGHGFNGFPPCIEDNPEWYNDRETKYKLVIHAEVNAILDSLHRRSLPLDDCTLYCTHPPCSDCAKFIAASGIKRLVCRFDGQERFSPERAKFITDKAGITIEIY